MSITQQKNIARANLANLPITHQPSLLSPVYKNLPVSLKPNQTSKEPEPPNATSPLSSTKFGLAPMSNDQLHLATPKVCPCKWATDRLPFPMFRWFQGFKMISRKSAMWIVETGCVNLFMIHEWLEGQHGSLILFMGTRNCRDFSC